MYGEHAKQEYRQAVRTILLDDAFVAKNKNNIFVSSIFFNHYLKRFGVIKNTALFVRELSPERVFEYERYLLQSKSTEFYYLELLKQKSPLVKYSPLMQVFRSRYHTICVTEFSQIRVTKFSTQLQANPDEVVRVCPQEL
jgi:hypothetical protein